MRKANRFILAITLCMTLVFLIACSKQSSEKRPPKEKWVRVTLLAKVESIDLKAAEVTLRGPKGSLVTLEVNPKDNRLSEVSLGDNVKTDYLTYFMAEFREPTKEEMENPLVVLSAAGKAPEDMPPGASMGEIVKAVVTIEGINLEEQQVTIKGPRGKYITLPVADKKLLKDLKKGETSVLTYAKAVALSLEKVDK